MSSSSLQPTDSSRLIFLDVMRGIASLSVFLAHVGPLLDEGFNRIKIYTFDAGQFGVLLFFLCSGFLIPLTLERQNSLAQFWVGRLARLFPLYWLVIGVVISIVTIWPGAASLNGEANTVFLRDPFGLILANMSMLQEILGYPHIMGVFWTLTIEMVFYLILSLLFWLRVMPRLLWLCTALFITTAIIGPLDLALGRPIVLGRLTDFSMLFGGFVLQQFFSGKLSRRSFGILMALLVCAMVSSAYCEAVAMPTMLLAVPRILERLGAMSLFGLILARGKGYRPNIFSAIGTISYSLYLSHGIVLTLLTPPGPAALRFIIWLGAALIVAALLYKLVEAPGIALGSRLRAQMRHSTQACAAQPERV